MQSEDHPTTCVRGAVIRGQQVSHEQTPLPPLQRQRLCRQPPPSLLPRFAIWVHHRRGFKRGPICDVNSDRGCIRVLMERTKEAGSAGKLIGPSLVSLVRVFKGRGVG